MPKISITLPVYNVEKYIAKSIQSVLNQTYTDFELLVIDDGSPDKSIEVVKQFSDPRIKIFSKENGGLSDARNYGLARATGKFVYFMDSDDWIEPILLEECVKTLETFHLDLVIFGYIQDNEDIEGKLINSNNVVPEKKHFIKHKTSIQLTPKLLGLMGYAWNKVYRREFLIHNKLKFEKGISLVEDILFNSGVYQHTTDLFFVDQAFYHYINRPAVSLIKKFHPDSFELKLIKNEALKRFMSSWLMDEKQQKIILSSSLVQGIRYCIHNLFGYQNGLNLSQKVALIKKMVQHHETRRLIQYYHPISITDRIYGLLINKQMYRTIALSAQLIKK